MSCAAISYNESWSKLSRLFSFPLDKWLKGLHEPLQLSIFYDNHWFHEIPIFAHIPKHQIIIRYNFAHHVLNTYDMDDSFWESLIFTDESRFCANPDCLRLWRKPNDFSPEVQQECEKFDISTMVWGAIGVDFKSDLVFIEGGLTAQKYVQLLHDSGFYEQVKEAYQTRKPIFQQDGAPDHLAQGTTEELTKHINLMSGWPPNSPDLSPIEMCWAIIKRRISFSESPFPSTIQELKERIKLEWSRLSQITINNLVMSFRERLLCVIKTKGRTISHYLSSHVRSTQIVEDKNIPEPVLFNEKDDDLMLGYYQKMGRKWKAIAEKLTYDYPPQVVKYRILLLNQGFILNQNEPIDDDNVPTLDAVDDRTELSNEESSVQDINCVKKKQKITFAYSLPPTRRHSDEISGESDFSESDSDVFQRNDPDDDILLT